MYSYFPREGRQNGTTYTSAKVQFGRCIAIFLGRVVETVFVYEFGPRDNSPGLSKTCGFWTFTFIDAINTLSLIYIYIYIYIDDPPQIY